MSVDQTEIELGDNFLEKNLRQITLTHELVVLFTHSSLARLWLFAGIGAAQALEKRVVGVLYGPSTDDLQRIGALSLIGEGNIFYIDKFDMYVDELSRRLKGH